MTVEWTDDYMKWKVETLALQKSHKEEVQKTGLWASNLEPTYGRRKDNNEYVIELSPGWR